MTLDNAEELLILKCLGGSQTYGTNTKTSDTDIKGIFIPPKEYWIGLQSLKSIEHHTDDIDTSYHSLKHFMALALNADPNILEMLYLRDNMYFPCKHQNIRKKLSILIWGTPTACYSGCVDSIKALI